MIDMERLKKLHKSLKTFHQNGTFASLPRRRTINSTDPVIM